MSSYLSILFAVVAQFRNALNIHRDFDGGLTWQNRYKDVQTKCVYHLAMTKEVPGFI